MGKISAVLQTGLLSTLIAFSSVSAQEDWSYSGDKGPKAWSKLPGSALCRSGQRQSPINIEGTDPVIMHRLITGYKVAPIDMKNDGRLITMAYSKGSYLTVGNKIFTLTDLSFHTPAEHTIAGKVYPMSIQFRHKAANGQWAIIESLVKEGKHNLAAQEFLDNIPLEPGQKMKQEKVMVNARDLMPTDKAYFRYMGSLTTPPCTEGVSWYVLKKPIQLSKNQIELVKSVVGGDSARPLQARKNRMILDARPQ